MIRTKGEVPDYLITLIREDITMFFRFCFNYQFAGKDRTTIMGSLLCRYIRMSLVRWKEKTPEFGVTYVDEYQKIANMSSLKYTLKSFVSRQVYYLIK
jgi:hypothetical protein